MFYFKNWEKFCSAVIETDLICLRACDVILQRPNKGFIIFKHDVETKPSKALKLAEIENKYGIRGSYYVQANLLNNLKNVKVLQQIKNLGHEVSYHYDVLDANNGNFEKANQEFQKNLQIFENFGFEIKTVCQHGNPVKHRKGYSSNRDFFRRESIANQYHEISDIVVNFREHTGVNFSYISDAGYAWNIILDPENNDRITGDSNIKLKGFVDLLTELKKGKSIIVSTHPHRWKKSWLSIYLRIIVFKIIRRNVKVLSKNLVINKILNHFYFLAKKI